MTREVGLPPSIDLRRAVADAPLVLTGLAELTPEEHHATRMHWRIHMAAELASARVFAALVPQMMAAGLPFEDIAAVADMARQELDHGVLSGRVYAALGGEPVSPYLSLAEVPTHPGCPPLEVVLRNLIAVSCCGETLAVAVVGAERERTSSPELRRVLTTILRDEVGHAAIGWRLLRDTATATTATMRRRLSGYLVAVFRRDIAEMQRGLGTPGSSWAALSIGAHDPALAWATYLDTMESATIPGLSSCGLAARWAFDRAMAETTRAPCVAAWPLPVRRRSA